MKEKLRAKLKEAGLPEYLVTLFKVNSDKDVDAIMTAFEGITDPNSTEFEEALNKAVANQDKADFDRKVTEAIKAHDKNLKTKFDLVEKKKDEPKPLEPTGNPELDELKKTIAALQGSITELVTKQSKETLAEAFRTRAVNEKKLPLDWVSKYSVDIADKLEETLATAEKEYTAFKQAILVEHYGGEPPKDGGKPADLNETTVTEFAKARNTNGTGETVVPGKKL
jgi:hypothetical protein